MSSTGLHICLETEGAPAREGDFELGSRWICGCGTNFVYREGFNRGGHLEPAWWEAPAVPQQRTPLSVRLFGPRKG
jgi:hypothetical protein